MVKIVTAQVIIIRKTDFRNGDNMSVDRVFFCCITDKKRRKNVFCKKMISLSIKIQFSFLVPCRAMKLLKGEAMNVIHAIHCILILLYIVFLSFYHQLK